VGTTAERSVRGEAGDSVRRRRRWSVQEKLQVVLETLERGVSVPVVARRHSLNANQLFSWRSQYRRREFTANAEIGDPVKLLAVQVDPSALPPAGQHREDGPPSTGCLEIQFCGTRHVKVWGAIDPQSLRVVIQELLRPC
jgi:transposase